MRYTDTIQRYLEAFHGDPEAISSRKTAMVIENLFGHMCFHKVYITCTRESCEGCPIIGGK